MRKRIGRRGETEKGFFGFFCIRSQHTYNILSGVHSNTVHEIGHQNSRQVQVGPTWRAT